MSITIHTLDARNNVMLEVMREYFKLSSGRMYDEIQTMARATSALLEKKDVDYRALRSALVPQQDRREAALLFNIDFSSRGSYSYAVHQRLLQLLNRKSSCSILHGDITDRGWGAFEEANRNLVRVGQRRFDNPMLYAVYINNLTDKMLVDIHRGMEDYPLYIGYVETTYASMFKALLSTQMINAYIQYRDMTIGQHEDDRHEDENVDLVCLGLNKHGYKMRSVPSTNFMLLLSYKIERPVVKGYQTDTEFSLNSISPIALPLDSFEIEIDPKKFMYLSNEKAKSLEGLGLLGGHVDQLKNTIQDRINHNYIYSMTEDHTHNIRRFNIIIEVKRADSGRPFRALVGLKYKPEERRLQFITLL